jgi:hypothetical protein
VIDLNEKLGKFSVILIAALMLASAAPLPGTTAEQVESRAPKDLTFFLHNSTTARYIFDYSTTYIANTTLANKTTFMGDQQRVRANWYIHPLLAGDFHVMGDVTVTIYLNTTGVSANGNLHFDLLELSHKAADATETVVWQDSSPNQGVIVQTGIDSYSATFPSIDHVFSAGNTLKLELEIQGGASAYFGMWFGDPTYDSRITFYSNDSMEIAEVYTLDYQDIPTVNYEFDVPDKTVKIRANITDPFGGYDINDVRLTLKDPDNVVLIDNESMTQINGTPISFFSIYETLWDYSGAEPGRYTVIVWAVDNNGYNYYHHREQYEFGPYDAEYTSFFWVGGLPANFFITVMDSGPTPAPLPGATVVADRGGKLVENFTDSNGKCGMGLFPTDYTFKVYWEDVEVASELTTVTDGGNLTITAAVYYPSFKVVDANNEPLAGASVFKIHPNGTVFLTPHVTNATGMFSLPRAPGGDYTFVVKWRDVEVANVVITVDSNNMYTINAGVYTLTVKAVDSHGDPLPGAQIVLAEATTGIVFDSRLTDLQGQIVTQQPVGTYDITVYWAEMAVGTLEDYALTDNDVITITCDVYFVAIQTVDSNDVPVSDAYVVVISSTSGSVMDSARTTDSGLTTVRLPAGTHDYIVYWRDIQVASGDDLVITGDIPETTPFKIVVEVFYAAVKVVDSKNNPLPNAMVTASAMGGGVFDFGQTSGNGTCMLRVPVGTHRIIVQWKGVDVADLNTFVITGDIPYSDPFIVNAEVYYLNVTVTDSKDRSVSNAALTVLHQNDEVADSALTGGDGTTVIRLPKSIYDFKVFWKDVEVGMLDNHNFTADGTITIKVSIHYLTIQIFDSKQIPVESAYVTVKFITGEVADSGATVGNGEVEFRLPSTNYDVVVMWKNVHVAEVNLTLENDLIYPVNAAIYYLTVKVVDVNGENVKDVEVSVLTKTGVGVAHTRTSGKGIAEFRLPHSEYDVGIHLSTTYLLTAVVESQEKPVVLESDQELKFTLKEYPPPIHETGAFVMALIIAVMIIVLILIYAVMRRKLKAAALKPRYEVVKQEVMDAKTLDEKKEPGAKPEDEPKLEPESDEPKPMPPAPPPKLEPPPDVENLETKEAEGELSEDDTET